MKFIHGNDELVILQFNFVTCCQIHKNEILKKQECWTYVMEPIQFTQGYQ